MSQIDLLRALQQDERVLDLAAAAMYKIREPKGSTRLSFEEVSPAKKARNRELAIWILSSVLERYPDSSKVSSPEEMKVFVAEQMYKMLAPNKSESFPFDQRTPFARTYYRERAETFMWNFLRPMVEPEQTQDKTRPITPHQSAASLPPTRRARSLPPSSEATPLRSSQHPLPQDSSTSSTSPTMKRIPPTAGSASGQSVSKAKSPIVESADREASATPESKQASERTGELTGSSPTPDQPNSLTMIGSLLVIVVILLVILIIRTF